MKKMILMSGMLIFLALGCGGSNNSAKIDEIHARCKKKLTKDDRRLMSNILMKSEFDKKDLPKLLEIACEQSAHHKDAGFIMLVADQYRKGKGEIESMVEFVKPYFEKYPNSVNILMGLPATNEKLGKYFEVKDLINLKVNSKIAIHALSNYGGFKDEKLKPHYDYLKSLVKKVKDHSFKVMLKSRLSKLK